MTFRNFFNSATFHSEMHCEAAFQYCKETETNFSVDSSPFVTAPTVSGKLNATEALGCHFLPLKKGLHVGLLD